MNIAALRCQQQQLMTAQRGTPAQLVAAMGGMQGQDFAGVKCSIAQRLSNVTVPDVDAAFDSASIVRTWPMRGTLHVLAAADVRWILSLTSPKNLAGSARRREQLELDDKTLAKRREVFTKALQGGKQLSRDEVYAALNAAHLSTEGQRGYHLLWNAALQGLICFASTTDKEQKFALLEEWLAPAPSKTHEEALAELAWRYFASHGPATLKDFMWWSGLTAADARAGFASIKAKLQQATLAEKTYWWSLDAAPAPDAPRCVVLSGFDEYLLGYQDRSAVLDAAYADKICPGGNGVFLPTIVINGQVVGTWQRTIKKSTLVMTAQPFTPLGKLDEQAFQQAALGYAQFMQMEARFV